MGADPTHEASDRPGPAPVRLAGDVKQELTSRQGMVDVMPPPRSSDPTATGAVARAGLTMILLGTAAAFLGPAWFDGVVKGLFLGAGVALIVLGVVTVGAARRPRPEGSWLPSRDE